jgi:hypothetical protein
MTITEWLNPNPKTKKIKDSKPKRVNLEKTVSRLIENMRPTQQKMNSGNKELLFGRIFNNNEMVYQIFREHNLGPKTSEADAKELGFADMLELQSLTAEALIAAAKVDFANYLKEKV